MSERSWRNQEETIEHRMIAGTTTKADAQELYDVNELLTAELAEARATIRERDEEIEQLFKWLNREMGRSTKADDPGMYWVRFPRRVWAEVIEWRETKRAALTPSSEPAGEVREPSILIRAGQKKYAPGPAGGGAGG